MAENQNRDVFPNENLNQGKSTERDEKSRTGNNKKNKGGKDSSSSRATRENTSSQGYGSSQRKDQENVGPLDADLNELPSKRRTSGNNQTGSGLG